jgi:antitoxin component YwqK of YwqJK toxin-antitoxin module
MRQILASMVLVVLLFPALALGGEVKLEDLVITNGLHYKKFTDVPFTGKVTGKTQGSFKDGKEHGPSVSYHDNGRIKEKGTYKDGKKDGPWVTYHDNGQLWFKGTVKDGKPDGPWVNYNKDGTVYESLTGTYKDGVKVK